MKASKKIIRDSFPIIRVITVKGEPYYQVDARKTGTDGKRMAFKSKADAETRANEIAAALLETGIEGIAFDSELRYMAMKGKALLQPYGKDILEGVNFYLRHLEQEAKVAESEKIETLLDRWIASIKKNSNKVLRDSTFINYKHHAKVLKAAFAGLRLRELTQFKFQDYLDGLDQEQSSKKTVLIKTRTFLNWCISQELIEKNPLAKIELQVEDKDVEIMPVEEAEALLRYCQQHYPAYTLYHAICLFAGLRPRECALLQWENIHLAERQITVLKNTSKVKETRNVPIEDNLAEWISSYKGRKLGFVTEQSSLDTVLTDIRKKALKWTKKKWDIMRHSYASYWLAKNKDRPHLAENMGNSPKIIGKHYKQVVAESAYKAFWAITSIPDEVKELSKLVKDNGFESLTLEQQYTFLTLHGELLPVYAKDLLAWDGLTLEAKRKNALIAWEFVQLKLEHPESGAV